ncbi:MAG: hypothetical protein HY291_17775 [Planctomycetes bacterium]|nr:hypothetical protein [Planctomycetota bacterium]
MPIPVLYADEYFIAVAKPAGIVVHQAPGPGPSLLRILKEEHGLNALTLVHRIDKDVSGILLLGRTKEAASAAHKVWDQAEKAYWALCEGEPPAAEGLIDAPILEHQTDRPSRMESALYWYREKNPGAELPPPPVPKTSAVHPAGRSSQTAYRLLESFRTPTGRWSWIEVSPRQGRMHQIRIHLKHAGMPLAADRLYGPRAELRVCDLQGGADARVVLARLPLHAAKLSLPHPFRKLERFKMEAELPEDLSETLDLLRKGKG